MASFKSGVRGASAAVIGLLFCIAAPASTQPVAGPAGSDAGASRSGTSIMPEAYPIPVQRGTPAQRARVAKWLYGLDLVTPETRERIITAWVSAWLASPYATPEEFPNNLNKHVVEVTRVGLDLAHGAEREWGEKLNLEVLVPLLILHDVDKPLLYVKREGKIEHTPLSRQLPHGVIGAMLLQDLGFDRQVINGVATHAANAPFHSPGFEPYVLHYADFFSADHALMASGGTPYYQRPDH